MTYIVYDIHNIRWFFITEIYPLSGVDYSADILLTKWLIFFLQTTLNIPVSKDLEDYLYHPPFVLKAPDELIQHWETAIFHGFKKLNIGENRCRLLTQVEYKNDEVIFGFQ